MGLDDVIGIIAVLAEIVILMAFLYSRVRGNVWEMLAELIALAEQTGRPGPEKMDMVVEALCSHVPAVFRGILTKDRLRLMAQDVFDWMKAYALEYLESKAGKGHPPDTGSGDGSISNV